MNELYHHGIKGQKWGVRRYQNSDGTLTAAGKVRKQKDLYKATVKYAKKGDKIGYKDYVDYQKKLGSQIDKKDLSSLKKIARKVSMISPLPHPESSAYMLNARNMIRPILLVLA